MTPVRDDDLYRPMTPEEQAFCDRMSQQFTDDMLQEYVRDDGPKYPVAQVLAEGDEIARRRWGGPANG